MEGSTCWYPYITDCLNIIKEFNRISWIQLIIEKDNFSSIKYLVSNAKGHIYSGSPHSS